MKITYSRIIIGILIIVAIGVGGVSAWMWYKNIQRSRSTVIIPFTSSQGNSSQQGDVKAVCPSGFKPNIIGAYYVKGDVTTDVSGYVSEHCNTSQQSNEGSSEGVCDISAALEKSGIDTLQDKSSIHGIYTCV